MSGAIAQTLYKMDYVDKYPLLKMLSHNISPLYHNKLA